MPTKIIFETEDQAMDDGVDTAAEAKPLKVSSVSGAALEKTEISVSSPASPCGAAC